jgi:hypothetical protein
MILIPDLMWGILSSTIAVVSMFPYIYKTYKGINRPHIFSWIIWSVLTGIAFAVQYTSHAGPGAWATGFTGLNCLIIVILSVKNGEKNITCFDWFTFIAALLSIPIWLVTDSPALAAIWVVIIDGLGYVPTIRKTWHKPHEEMALTHGLQNIKHLCSILAMQSLSVATTLYPVALFGFNAVLVLVILLRRKRLLQNP